ncbi:TPA: fimbrial protein [Serratia marcescens]
MQRKMRVNLFFILPCLLCGGPVSAAEEVAINLRGGLIAPPPCVINSGTKIDVNFGERIGVNKVDGKNYRQKIDYAFTCEQNALPWQMTMTLKGGVGFDKAALQTNNESLNIRVYQNNIPFIINSSISIDAGNLPILEAVPISKPDTVLHEGEFFATGTLLIEYL